MTAAEQALAAVRRATKKRDRAEQEWRDALRSAAAVCPLRAVGDAAGVTHTRVHQLTNGRDAVRPPG